MTSFSTGVSSRPTIAAAASPPGIRPPAITLAISSSWVSAAIPSAGLSKSISATVVIVPVLVHEGDLARVEHGSYNDDWLIGLGLDELYSRVIDGAQAGSS